MRPRWDLAGWHSQGRRCPHASGASGQRSCHSAEYFTISCLMAPMVSPMPSVEFRPSPGRTTRTSLTRYSSRPRAKSNEMALFVPGETVNDWVSRGTGVRKAQKPYWLLKTTDRACCSVCLMINVHGMTINGQ